MLNADLLEILNKVGGVLKTLEAGMSKPMKDTEAKKICKELPAIDKMYDNSVQMAKNFGYELPGSKSKKRKRTQA